MGVALLVRESYSSVTLLVSSPMPINVPQVLETPTKRQCAWFFCDWMSLGLSSAWGR